jgi:hypothetical protein
MSILNKTFFKVFFALMLMIQAEKTYTQTPSYKKAYRKCANNLCGKPKKNPIGSFRNFQTYKGKVPKEKIEDFKKFKPQIIDYFKHKEEITKSSINNYLEVLQNLATDSKIIDSFIKDLLNDVEIKVPFNYAGLDEVEVVIPSGLEKLEVYVPELIKEIKERKTKLSKDNILDMISKKMIKKSDLLTFLKSKVLKAKHKNKLEIEEMISSAIKYFPNVKKSENTNTIIKSLEHEIEVMAESGIPENEVLRAYIPVSNLKSWHKDNQNKFNEDLAKINSSIKKIEKSNIDDFYDLVREIIVLLPFDAKKEEKLCGNNECRKRIVDFFKKSELNKKLLLAQTQSIQRDKINHLADRCQGYWVRSEFMNGSSDKVREYEQGLPQAVKRLKEFAKKQGINDEVKVNVLVDSKNQSHFTLDRMKEKIINKKYDESLFDNEVNLRKMLNWMSYGKKFNLEEDLLYSSPCALEYFMATSYAGGTNIDISRKDAEISALNKSFGIFFHEGGHILEELIGQKPNVDIPCPYSELRSKASRFFRDVEDRELYFSETIADIIAVLLESENSNSTFCRMMETTDNGKKYLVDDLLPEDEHLGPLARVLLESKLKKKKLPSSCHEVINENKRLVFDEI